MKTTIIKGLFCALASVVVCAIFDEGKRLGRMEYQAEFTRVLEAAAKSVTKQEEAEE